MTELFTPFSFGRQTLANRIVMAPMTRRFSPGGVPGADVARYYRSRAEGGVGLIVTEGIYMQSPGAGIQPLVPVLDSAEALAGWRHVIDEVHAANGKIVPQLWHSGRLDLPETAAQDDTDSVSQQNAVLLRRAFAVAARQAEILGFDGVEIHGGGRRTVDLFRWVRAPDGSLPAPGQATRRQLSVDVLHAIRRAVAPDFQLLFRFSEWRRTDGVTRLADSAQQLSELLLPLVEAGADIFHVATDAYAQPAFPGASERLAQWTRKLTARPVIAGGGIGQGTDLSEDHAAAAAPPAGLDELLSHLGSEGIDLVEVGRALLADPQWPVKVAEGRFAEVLHFDEAALQQLVM